MCPRRYQSCRRSAFEGSTPAGLWRRRSRCSCSLWRSAAPPPTTSRATSPIPPFLRARSPPAQHVTVAVTFTDDTGAAPKAVAVAVDRTVSPMTAGSGSFTDGRALRDHRCADRRSACHHLHRNRRRGRQGDHLGGLYPGRGRRYAGAQRRRHGRSHQVAHAEPTARSTPAPTPVAGDGGNGGRGKSGSGDDGGGATPRRAAARRSRARLRRRAAEPHPIPPARPDRPESRRRDHERAECRRAGWQRGAGLQRRSQRRRRPDDRPVNRVGRREQWRRQEQSTNCRARSSGATGRPRSIFWPATTPHCRRCSSSWCRRSPRRRPAAVAWAAFVIFGKRRRDGDDPEPDSRLAAAAATGVDTGAAQGLRVVDESQLPRWRRPSLQQVRRTDPLRVVAEAPTMSFAGAGVRPLESYERR